MPAELTSTRTGPMLLAISTALMMSSVLVTSTLANAPPISSASALPLSSCRSAMTTLAPLAASSRADAAPMPEAPPVTIALAPVMSMARDAMRADPRPSNRARPSSRRRRRTGSDPRPLRPLASHPQWTTAARPGHPAVTAGRRHQGSSLNVPAVVDQHVADRRPRRHAQAGDRDAPGRVLQPLRQPDRARVRGRHRRPRGRRRRPRVRVGHGCHRLHRPRTVLSRRPHRDPAPDLRRHDGVRAGSMRPLRHRAHRRRRHRARRVRRGRPSRPDDARARREPVEPAPRPRRPRRPRRRQRAVHRPRLDVRHPDRPAAAAPRHRSRPALGDEGHRRAQRRHARRHRRRRDLLEAIWSYGVLHGSTPSPHDALNGLHGIRTLAVRQHHQAAVALRVADSSQRILASRPSTSPACPTTRSTPWRPSS